jgi:acetyl/propionyl-CoA carboxylase alpha subunit/acetyl-CoA carboxylase carboxyltransferase component
MTLTKLLVANRGEIAIRVLRSAADMGLATVAVYSQDDAAALHTRQADVAVALNGVGAGAYLDGAQIIAVAKAQGCDAIHPGYGFLSENAGFAADCVKAGLTFVGPGAEVLALFGDKGAARQLAMDCGVPVVAGINRAVSLDEAKTFYEALGQGAAMMIKALAGGGGRGMRVVSEADQIEAAFERCGSEAKAAFGDGSLFVERLIRRARHIEIQIIGDGQAVLALGERECSLQRQHQKLVEIAPSPSLTPALRSRLTEAALRLAKACHYTSLGTFEFLIDLEADPAGPGAFAFIEANPRLQVEHTVTEAVTGLDLVALQLGLAGGLSLAELGLEAATVPAPKGYAIQLRVNMETMDAAGQARPSSGTLSLFEPPTGPGIRVDTFGYAGYRPSPHFDSLLAKVIVASPSPDYAKAVAKAARSLAQFRLRGVASNIGFLRALLARPDVVGNQVYTRFIEDHGPALFAAQSEQAQDKTFESETPAAAFASAGVSGPEGSLALIAPMSGKVVGLEVATGDLVRQGQAVAVLESMKMEHVICADRSGYVRAISAAPGETIFETDPLMFIEPAEVEAVAEAVAAVVDLYTIRPDLADMVARHAFGLDENRPEAVACRHGRNQRMARENIADLCDDDSFIEYGALAVAAQRRRRTLDDLIRNTPADGMITGIGAVNGASFGEDKARTAVLAYDFTVLAGTQGMMNHKKTDRLLGLVEDWQIPLVLFAEGGGGRPGDVDSPGVAGLDVPSFLSMAKLSGQVPLIGIVSGRCFAGNAALLGCTDVIIAAADSNIGMGGPAMIEGGGLGVFKPEDIGPMSVQTRNGVVDIAVADEAEAVAVAKQYLSYFQGSLADWSCADQRLLRQAIPENRLRAYLIGDVIQTLADTGSVLELRKDFGLGIVTALVRIEGRPMGLMANNPHHLGGAIDADAADKAARFMQLCQAYGLPILSLCDTPGFMVGPDVEKTAQVRHVSRMFVTAASLTVPVFAVVLRKGYGLGAQAMTGGSFHAPVFNIAWPTGEFGGMGLEGAVRLGFKKELETIENPVAREAEYNKRVARSYEIGKAVNMAAHLEIDGVIDPLETRRWVLRGLKSMPPRTGTETPRKPFIDTW